jgi:hypothetical protein
MAKYTMIRGLLLSTALCCLPLPAQEQIPAGSKVFVAPMDGFETYLKAALDQKKVPLTVVEDRDKADFEISGAADSQKAGAAKKIIMLDWRSKEQASIKVTNIKTSVVVFAYSVHKASSAHGKRSSAEACAKHLKEKVKAGGAKS